LQTKIKANNLISIYFSNQNKNLTMKKLFFLAFAILVSSSVYAQNEDTTVKTNVEEVKVERKAHIEFSEDTYDFTEITQGDVVTHVFDFKNTGKYPLIISNVRTTCGCTVPVFPKGEPIAPGASEKITVKFNSRGKLGMQRKVITIYSNADNAQSTVTLVGNVKTPVVKETNK
jgi:uncharacterized cupredoxin-like copper-binding protein